MFKKQHMVALANGGQVHNIGLTIRPLANPLAKFGTSPIPSKDTSSKSTVKKPKFEKQEFIDSDIHSVASSMNSKLSAMADHILDMYDTSTPIQITRAIKDYNRLYAEFNTKIKSYESMTNNYIDDMLGDDKELANEYAVSKNNKVYIQDDKGIREVDYKEATKKDKDGYTPHILTNSELANGIKSKEGFDFGENIEEYNNIYNNFFSNKETVDDVYKKINENFKRGGSQKVSVNADDQSINLELNGNKLIFNLKGKGGKNLYYSAVTNTGDVSKSEYDRFINGLVSKGDRDAVKNQSIRNSINYFSNISDENKEELRDKYKEIRGDGKDISDDELMNLYVNDESNIMINDMILSSVSDEALIRDANDKALKGNNGRVGKWGEQKNILQTQKETINVSNDANAESSNTNYNVMSFRTSDEKVKSGNFVNSSYSKALANTGDDLKTYGANSIKKTNPNNVNVIDQYDINLSYNRFGSGITNRLTLIGKAIGTNSFKEKDKLSEIEKQQQIVYSQKLYKQYILYKNGKLYKENGKSNFSDKQLLIDKDGKLINTPKGIINNDDILSKIKTSYDNRRYAGFYEKADKNGHTSLSYSYKKSNAAERKNLEEIWNSILNNKDASIEYNSKLIGSSMLVDTVSSMLHKGKHLYEMTSDELKYVMGYIAQVRKSKTEYSKKIYKDYENKLIQELERLDDDKLKVVALGFDSNWATQLKDNLNSVGENASGIILNPESKKGQNTAYDIVRGTGLYPVSTNATTTSYEKMFNRLDTKEQLNELRMLKEFTNGQKIFKTWRIDTSFGDLLSDSNAKNKPYIYTLSILKKIGEEFNDIEINKETLESGKLQNFIRLFSKINPTKAYIGNAKELQDIAISMRGKGDVYKNDEIIVKK